MPTAIQSSPLGATLRGDLVDFHLWAPRLSSVTLRLFRRDAPPKDYPMLPANGHWTLTLPASAGDRYQYISGNLALPDPVSRLLPEGVHGPTEIVDPNFAWSDKLWRGLPLPEYVIYELHVGTFTTEGTLDAAISRLDYLHDLGVTVIELMPLNATPGARNWGYDGVGLYAVQASYGGPAALRRFVDAAHYRGLAVIVDVVYNHFGNEGNYLAQFGPYFSGKHKTPWGDGINYDDTGSAHVRRFIVENAVYWLREYHLDGLRLDATQTIKDDSPQHIVAEIAARAHQFGAEAHRTIVVTVETDENQPRYVLPAGRAGYAADAVWSDDFHHAIHVLLTGEKKGYYQDFANPDRLPTLMIKVLTEPFAFQGEPFQFWEGRARGADPEGVPLPSQIICIQNHDQVGNRALGERLTKLAPAGARKLAAALLLLAPHTPLIFMGQEYDESARFQFFTDFGDPVIKKAVSEGRRREFADFDWTQVPDPQDPATFERSRLQWLQHEENLDMLTWYRALLRLRRKYVIPNARRTAHAEWTTDDVLVFQVPASSPQLLILASHDGNIAVPPNEWQLELDANQDGYQIQIYRR